MVSDINVSYDRFSKWWKLSFKKQSKEFNIYLISGNEKHTEKAAIEKAEQRLDKESPNWREGE